MVVNHSSKTQFRYSILAFMAAALWGLYWLPLRKIEAAGVSAAWSIIAIYAVPLLFLLPLVWLRRQSLRQNWRSLLVIGLVIGAALSCYATAFLHTSVLRSVLLFYTTPVWSTLLGILLLNEKNSLRRWVAMTTGFCGLILMLFNTDPSTAQPFGPGEFTALLAGFLWGLGTVYIRKSPSIDAAEMVPVQYFFAVCTSVLFLFLSSSDSISTVPDWTSWLKAMPYIIGFYVVIILPTLFICSRAAQILSPGRIGILMMSEVLVAGISAPLLVGETLSNREWLAAALIILAGVIEVTRQATTAPAASE